ncbi:Caleosin-domain-containing protein [Ascobolus immersus RN42]|uniref:Caleosin-domain-containing protein n=1 Tax=Ascobolus immersus RN42 TaxID=1160509 RepID=A0A3N4IIL2_ASCIM|nr:Caleosin-domain-containing protein [Ascobolus immersus RN42]
MNNRIVSVDTMPITVERTPFIPTKDQLRAVGNFGTARANVAPSADTPQGTPDNFKLDPRRSHQTVMQQHIDFFDPDQDGIIWPLDTFRGFRQLGSGYIISILAMLIIHANLSYPTVKGFLPDPFFRIWIERIHKCKHGSDTGTYDTEGRFSPQHFEDFFAKYSGSANKDGLSAYDIWNGIKGQRLVMDPFGWLAAIFEWTATYTLLWPADGILKKEDVRRVYDGSIFYHIAEERKEKAKLAKGRGFLRARA